MSLRTTLSLLIFTMLLSGCQSLINYTTDDLTRTPESERKTSFECRDVSPPQLDNEIIRCREV